MDPVVITIDGTTVLAAAWCLIGGAITLFIVILAGLAFSD